jgi:prevent-host-death family protein
MPYIKPATILPGAAMSAALDHSLAANPTPAAFAEALARAEHDKGRTVVTREGRPVAALVPIEDADRLEALEDEADSRLAAEALADWEARGRPAGIPLADIARDLGIDLTAEPDAAP